MDAKVVEYLKSIDSDCVRCGICLSAQEEFGQNPMMFGDIASRLLEAIGAAEAQGRELVLEDIPDDIVDFSRACLTCGRCTADCPVDIRAGKAVMAARAVIAAASPEIARSYRRYRCDLDDSMFSRMRETTGGVYEEFLPREMPAEPTGESGHVLFFPGCTLANNFPQLAQITYEVLVRDGHADSMTTFCCGRPLGLSGLSEERRAYGHGLCERLRAMGVSKIITACPNCYYELRPLLAEEGLAGQIELEFLAETLADAGWRYQPDEVHDYPRVAMHDSCPDRHDGVVARSMRRLFDNVEVVESENSRLHSLCCGSGGFASVYRQDICNNHFTRGVTDFFDTQSWCLVSGCATCAASYKFSGAVQAAHYLELLFGFDMDMGTYGNAIDTLWDPQNERNLDNFPVDRPFFVQPGDEG